MKIITRDEKTDIRVTGVITPDMYCRDIIGYRIFSLKNGSSVVSEPMLRKISNTFRVVNMDLSKDKPVCLECSMDNLPAFVSTFSNGVEELVPHIGNEEYILGEITQNGEVVGYMVLSSNINKAVYVEHDKLIEYMNTGKIVVANAHIREGKTLVPNKEKCFIAFEIEYTNDTETQVNDNNEKNSKSMVEKLETNNFGHTVDNRYKETYIRRLVRFMAGRGTRLPLPKGSYEQTRYKDDMYVQEPTFELAFKKMIKIIRDEVVRKYAACESDRVLCEKILVELMRDYYKLDRAYVVYKLKIALTPLLNSEYANTLRDKDRMWIIGILSNGLSRVTDEFEITHSLYNESKVHLPILSLNASEKTVVPLLYKQYDKCIVQYKEVNRLDKKLIVDLCKQTILNDSGETLFDTIRKYDVIIYTEKKKPSVYRWVHCINCSKNVIASDGKCVNALQIVCSRGTSGMNTDYGMVQKEHFGNIVGVDLGDVIEALGGEREREKKHIYYNCIIQNKNAIEYYNKDISQYLIDVIHNPKAARYIIDETVVNEIINAIAVAERKGLISNGTIKKLYNMLCVELLVEKERYNVVKNAVITLKKIVEDENYEPVLEHFDFDGEHKDKHINEIRHPYMSKIKSYFDKDGKCIMTLETVMEFTLLRRVFEDIKIYR